MLKSDSMAPAPINWDDLRFILAVAESGSAIAAAKLLGVNSTTVQRRISRFESDNAVHLFQRRQTGLTATVACEALVESAREIEGLVSGVRREILGRDSRLEGRLTITTTDSFMTEDLASQLDEFRRLHPAIQLEVTVTNSRLSLSRQDADIAIRPSNNPPEHLVGQRVGNLSSAIYKRVNSDIRIKSDYNSANWVGLREALQGSPNYGWIRENIAKERIVASVDTFVGVERAIAAGIGLGLLPCLLGDRSPNVERIGEPIESLNVSIWVLTHPEIRNAARVRAFMEFITQFLRLEIQKFGGH